MFHTFDKTTRSYATEANALAAAEKLCTQFNSAKDSRAVLVFVQSFEGRFSPVFYLRNQEAFHIAQYIARHGFMTIG